MPIERSGRRKYSKKDLGPVEWYFSDLITITSATGVGGTSTLNYFREKYKNDPKRRFNSAGELVAEFAKLSGMSKPEFNTYMTEHPEEDWDHRIDSRQASWGNQNYSMNESRLAHILANHAFHVLLICPVMVCAERRAKDERTTVEYQLERIARRDRENKERYDRLYPGWEWPYEDYDLVVSSQQLRTWQICERIEAMHANWRANMPSQMIRTVAP